MIGKLCSGRSYQWFAVKLGSALGEVPTVLVRGLGLFNISFLIWVVELKVQTRCLEADNNLRKVALLWRSVLEFSVPGKTEK